MHLNVIIGLIGKAKREQMYFLNKLNIISWEKLDVTRQKWFMRGWNKCTIIICRKKHWRTQTDKLVQACFKNAKEYWKLLKGSLYYGSSKIMLDLFVEYIKAMNIILFYLFFFQADEVVLSVRILWRYTKWSKGFV